MSDQSKEIWLPKSETKVTVQDGKIYISETMVMESRAVQGLSVGFSQEEKK